MVLYGVILTALLHSQAIPLVFGWSHVSRVQFHSILSEDKVALVAFTAPWTDGCKSLEPEWVATAKLSRVPLLSIDCTTESELCEENKIFSYPAIRLFRGINSMTRYRGPRRASEIVSFINYSMLPIISILDDKNITSFKSISEAVFIAYLTPRDADLKSIFTEFATRHHDKFAFGIASNTNLAKSNGVPNTSIVCYKILEGEQEIFTGQPGISALEEFRERVTEQPIGEMTRRNEMKYLEDDKSLVYIFAITESERSTYRTSLKPLAKKYQEYLNFVTVDAVEYKMMAPALGLEAGIFPALAVQNPMYGQVFLFDQRRVITLESTESFIIDIVQGRVQPRTNEAGREQDRHNHDEL